MKILPINSLLSTIWYDDPKMFAIIIVLCFIGILFFKEYYDCMKR